MTVNSTLGSISKDIVWVYTLLEHYTVILSLWVGGFTRINTICLVKKKISRCLFFRCFSFLSVEKLLTRRLNGDGSGVKSLCKDKAKQTKWNTQIYAHLFFFWVTLFFLASPKIKDKPSETVCGPFQCLTKSSKEFCFFFFIGDLWAAIHEWWVEETIVPGWLILFSSSSCFYPTRRNDPHLGE